MAFNAYLVTKIILLHNDSNLEENTLNWRGKNLNTVRVSEHSA